MFAGHRSLGPFRRSIALGCVGLLLIPSTSVFALTPPSNDSTGAAPTLAAPLTAEESAALEAKLALVVAESNQRLAQRESFEEFSRRADALFFLGRFEEAVADYDATIRLAPEIADRHWQRGLALYEAGRYEDGAAQFAAYQKGGDVDRENGLWKFLCEARQSGVVVARRDMIPYSAPDRHPLPLAYDLYRGALSLEDYQKQVHDAKVDPTEQLSSRFYGDLYLGLFLDLNSQPELAQQHLAAAVKNRWGLSAGYGPRYMWHVARLEEARVRAKLIVK